MTISNRAKLIIAGVLVLIAIILILLFLPRPGQQTVPPVTTPTNEQPETPSVPEPTPVPPVTPEAREEASAETVAKIFVERYGSYSTESDFANLEDVLPLLTASYRATIEAQIETLRDAPPSESYYGVSTKVISTSFTSKEDTTATIEVLTQREEAQGSVTNISVKYQTIVLNMKEEGGEWLVDKATWR